MTDSNGSGLFINPELPPCTALIRTGGEQALMDTTSALAARGPEFAEDLESLAESMPYLTRVGEASEPIPCECCGTSVIAVPESRFIIPRRWQRGIWEPATWRRHTLRRCEVMQARGNGSGPRLAVTPVYRARMKRDRCPTCRGILPPPKTCANPRCAKVFYRGENGRVTAVYCSMRCGTAHRVRRWRAARAAKAARVTASARAETLPAPGVHDRRVRTVSDLDAARTARRQRVTAAAIMHPALRWTAGGEGDAHRRRQEGGAWCGAPGPLTLAAPAVPLCPACYGPQPPGQPPGDG